MKLLRKLVFATSIALVFTTAKAGIIDFTSGISIGDLTVERTISGTGPSVRVDAFFDNPFTEQGTDGFYANNGLMLGSDGLTISWDVVFSETVSLTEIELGFPIIVNLGFNVVGGSINESGLLANAGAGNYILDMPLLLEANTTYTFSSVSRNITDPITSAGGLRFATWTFGEVNTQSVSAPAISVLIATGLIMLVFARKTPRR